MKPTTTLTVTALALAAALSATSPRPADAALRCGTRTYTITPALPGGGGSAGDQLVLQDGLVSIPGCEPVEPKMRARRTGEVRVTAKWGASACQSMSSTSRLKLLLAADCESGSGMVRQGKPILKTTRFTATTATPTPAPEVTIDPAVVPSSDTLPPSEDGGTPRPLAAMTDASGLPVEFVADELVLRTADDTVLADFLTRWNGTLISTLAFADYGIEGPSFHLVRIDTTSADVASLTANLKALDPDRPTSLRVSNEAALQLLAASASETLNGVGVALNFVATSTAYRDRALSDGAGFDNAFLQKHLRANCDAIDGACRDAGVAEPNTGVTEAWRALDAAGRLGNRVPVAVIDRGFSTAGTGLPAVQNLTPTIVNQSNAKEPTKPWHATQVSQTLAAVHNDGVGVAGVGGPVVNLMTYTSSDLVDAARGVLLAFQSGARIINMSFGARVPAVETLVNPGLSVLNMATQLVAERGVLIFASAGNDHQDVDHEDCFIACWEEAWWTPCENDGVLCVGGLDDNGQVDPSSNYGSNDVDLWAPFTVLAGPTPGSNFVYSVSGTSFSSPFTAGVAALVWAANPALSPGDVVATMLAYGNRNQPPQVDNTVNAYRAVIAALGGTPPEVDIAVDAQTVFGSCNTQFELRAQPTDVDGGPLAVYWSSNVQGALGSGESLLRPLSDGRHYITATVVDAAGFAGVSKPFIVDVDNASSRPRPTVDILSLTNHQTFATNQTVTFEAGGLDPNKALGGLVAANVRWVSSKDGELGSGQRIYRTLTPGAHYIYVYYTGICGGTADDFRLIQVNGPADAPPNMSITTPSNNDLVLRTDNTGYACLRVGGFGYDEEDRNFVTPDWWETNRSDLQWKVLSFDQSATVCLRLAAGAAYSTHEIRLRGIDSTGHIGYSAPLRVTVLPGIN